MKKFFTIFLLFVLLTTFCGCGAFKQQKPVSKEDAVARKLTDLTKVEKTHENDYVKYKSSDTGKNTTVAGKKIINKEIFDAYENDEGEVLVYVSGNYPQINNNFNELFVEEINEVIKRDVDYSIVVAPDILENAKKELEEKKDKFHPYSIEYNYEIKYNKNNILSIVTDKYYSTGGVHPVYSKTARNYDISKCRTMTLRDVINEQASDKKFATVLSKLFRDNILEDYKKAISGLDVSGHIENVSFYLTEDGMGMFFDLYQLGPYAVGIPESFVPYDETNFLLNLKDGTYN